MKSIRLIVFCVFLIILAVIPFHIYQYLHQPSGNVLIFYQVVEPESNSKTNDPKNSLTEMEKQVFFTLLGGFVSATMGGFVAWWLDKLRTKNEKSMAAESRRRNFIAVMNQIRHQASFVNYDNMGDFYKNLLPQISYQTGLIRDDFAHVSVGFDECLISLYRLDETKINEPQNQMPIMQTIDSLIGFVERNHKKGQ